MAKAKAVTAEPSTDYQKDAEGTLAPAQEALAAAIRRHPVLEGELEAVIAHIGLPAEAATEVGA